ncbi:MAG TPA: LysR family transcriptional regulator [Candidatus Blautia faecipullorum]|nr:LysR family transcriptional regulator [Candidatus Blautia faecipullorum]
MTIKDMENFRTVCREQSITKAARLLYITPQGLSKSIKNLESELNTQLLNRSSFGITLTETGQYLYDHISELLDSYYNIYNGIQKIQQTKNREIDLLSAYGILRLVTPECITDFRRKHPEITVHYREYPDKQVERLFLQKEGNVAFTIGPSDSAEFHSDLLESFPVKLLVNRQNPLSSKASVTIEDLRNQPLYLESSEFYIHHLIVKRCMDAGFTPDIVFETSGFSLCHKMVRKNLGISVVVDFIFDDMGDDSMVLIPFSDGSYQWSTYMLTRKDLDVSPDILLFQKHVLKWMNDIKNGAVTR